VLHVVDAVTRSGMDSHLGDTLADGPTVTEVASFRGANAAKDAGSTDAVFEAGELGIELVRAQERVHCGNVSLWIRPCKGLARTVGPASRSTRCAASAVVRPRCITPAPVPWSRQLARRPDLAGFPPSPRPWRRRLFRLVSVENLYSSRPGVADR
jgi:hypothetical protein